MHSVKINMENSVYEKVMFLLKNLPSVEVVEDIEIEDKSKEEILEDLKESATEMKKILSGEIDEPKSELKDLIYELKDAN